MYNSVILEFYTGFEDVTYFSSDSSEVLSSYEYYQTINLYLDAHFLTIF